MTLTTISEHAAALRGGSTTSLALLEAALERIADPAGEGQRTFIRVYADKARAEARVSDLLRESGLARSPLDGVPVSIKDLFDVAGETTLAGSVIRGASQPGRSSSGAPT